MTDKQTIAVYEARADDYAGIALSPSQTAALDGFLARLPEGATILDIGCGPGRHAQVMLAAGHHVIGLDPTPAFVDAARALGVDARLGTFEDLSGTAAYDGIYASFSLLHAPKPDLPRHIAAMARALKPGGTLFLGMKTGEGEVRDSIGRRYTYVTEAELIALVTAAGLRITDTVTGAEKGLAGSVDPYILMTAHA